MRATYTTHVLGSMRRLRQLRKRPWRAMSTFAAFQFWLWYILEFVDPQHSECHSLINLRLCRLRRSSGPQTRSPSFAESARVLASLSLIGRWLHQRPIKSSPADIVALSSDKLSRSIQQLSLPRLQLLFSRLALLLTTFWLKHNVIYQTYTSIFGCHCQKDWLLADLSHGVQFLCVDDLRKTQQRICQRP